MRKFIPAVIGLVLIVSIYMGYNYLTTTTDFDMTCYIHDSKGPDLVFTKTQIVRDPRIPEMVKEWGGRCDAQLFTRWQRGVQTIISAFENAPKS